MRAMVMKVSLLLLLSTSALAGQVYKWVDAQGVTHFDAQPPAGQNVTPIETKKPTSPTNMPKSSAPPSNDAKQKAADAKVKQEVSEIEQRTQDYCDQARNNLAQLNNNPRVRQEINGETRRMTEQERQAKITETKATIDHSCE